MRSIRHFASDDLLAVLNQNRLMAIFENDIVLRVAFPLLFLDFFVKLVARILGFPIAKWHTDFVQESTINVTAVFSRANVLVFSNEDEILLPSPLLQEVFEGFSHHRFSGGARRGADPVQIVEIPLN